MIVADRKPLAEILTLVRHAGRILLVGCQECVTVCLAGGEREVAELSLILRLARAQGRAQVDGPLEVITATVHRQCDDEFLAPLADQVANVDCVVSMSCGVGVQHMAAYFPHTWVVPALNTRFAGATIKQGLWEERCSLCGDCQLYRTGGICPITRCAKSLLNGPCGGSHEGHCEISADIPCAWQQIYDHLRTMGKLELIEEIVCVKDWSRARDGGLRRSVREDVS